MEARERAVEMLTKAQAASEEIKNASESYVMHLLTETEQYLNTNLQEVQQTKNRIHNRKNKKESLHKSFILNLTFVHLSLL